MTERAASTLRFGAIAALLIAATVAEAADIPIVPVGAPPFVEFRPKVEPATAEPFVAASADLADGRRPPERPLLTIDGIDPADRVICVDVRSADGSYRASATLPNPRRGPVVALSLPTDAPMRLGAPALKLPARVRASTTTSCSEGDPLLPSAWGTRPGRVGLVLASQLSQVSVLSASQPPSGCVRLRDAVNEPLGNVSGLDTVCPLPKPPACGSEATVTIQMRDGSNYRPVSRLRVRGTCRPTKV